MKKFVYSISAAILFGLYVLGGKYLSQSTLPVVQIQDNTLSSGGQTATNASSSPTPTSVPTKNSSGLTDGQYTGSREDAYYGYVQVKATIQNGKLTNVQFLEYPNDRHTSVEINSQAVPLLTQEAISVQSAQVDAVSGATDTSLAFRKSLAAALSQAKGL